MTSTGRPGTRSDPLYNGTGFPANYRQQRDADRRTDVYRLARRPQNLPRGDRPLTLLSAAPPIAPRSLFPCLAILFIKAEIAATIASPAFHDHTLQINLGKFDHSSLCTRNTHTLEGSITGRILQEDRTELSLGGRPERWWERVLSGPRSNDECTNEDATAP